MDWGKIFSTIKYELNKQSHRYQESESVEDRKASVNGYIKTINYLQQVLAGEVPDFYRSPLQNLLQISRDELVIMQRDVNSLPVKRAVIEEGGGGRRAGPKEDEVRAQGLLDTIVAEKPNVKWEDIAGLNEAKKSLHEALIMPIKYPNFFVGNVQPWKGILLYGPPGTGKTFLAKACATECESTFFSVSSSDIMSKYMGEAEKMIKELFRVANEKAPSIIFIDEIDSMCGNRSETDNESSKRVKTEFLVQMQGVGNQNEKVLVLGATNLPWALDPAVRRRFERRVYIPLPEDEARMYLMRNKLRGLDKNLSDEDIGTIAHKTDGYSGSDLEILCRDAAFEPLHLAQRTNKFKKINNGGKVMYMPVDPSYNGGDVIQSSVYDLPQNSLFLPDLVRSDLESALKRTKPSVAKSDLKQYEDWTKEFGVSD